MVRSFCNNLRGFTLIELLVAVGIIGTLTVSLLAVVSPFEQLQKSHDTNLKRIAAEFADANNRYYISHATLPWYSSSNGGNDCYSGGDAFSATPLTNLINCINVLVTEGELKSAFTNRENKELSSLFVTNLQSSNADATIVCFLPKSTAQQKDGGTRYKQDGTPGTSCKSQGGTQDCYWCTSAASVGSSASIAPPNSQPTSPVATLTNNPTPTVTPTSTPTSVSGESMPVGDLGGWRQIFAEDFAKDAPVGSWGSECDAQKIVYTGATGTKWKAYPKCYLDTYDKRPYRSDAVLSVHDGVLDFYLHNVDGVPAGANPAPVLNNVTLSMYQTYGRYSARFRVDTNALNQYYVAWLLWPQNDGDWECAESDFPEGRLSATSVSVFHHYGCAGSQDYFSASIDFTKWHTFTQEWTPTSRKYYLDGALIGTSTKPVYSGPQRWQLQTETKGTGTSEGHLLLDWVVVYAYLP